jgi:hypothetical protein
MFGWFRKKDKLKTKEEIKKFQDEDVITEEAKTPTKKGSVKLEDLFKDYKRSKKIFENEILELISHSLK